MAKGFGVGMPAWRLVSITLLTGIFLTGTVGSARAASTPFAGFVDDYLDGFARHHPSIAAGNGLHSHDGELEDFSAAAVAREIAWLHGERARLAAFDPGTLDRDERADREILLGIIDGWLLDLERIGNWRRNPMIYVSAVSDGIHDLVTMDAVPAGERMHAIVTKLHGVPALVTSARHNIKAPPRVFVERAVAMLDGVDDLLEHDLPLAFSAAGDAEQRASLIEAASRARGQLHAYRQWLATQGMANATGRFAVGIDALEARYRAEELIDLPATRLLSIGERELATEQARFTQLAARVDPTRPALSVWRDVQHDHPARGQLVPAANALVDELFAFVRARGIVDVPADEHVTVAPAPAYDLGMASMHSSPPLEAHPIRSYYYVTDADAGWPKERQDAWLEAFNYATLADITAHEVVPGHYVHSLYMRRTPGKIRRIWIGLNPFPQPSSGQDGWAHYAEQLVADQGFHADDARYALAQSAEALNRICRLIAGIRLHAGEWTIDQAADFFEREAHLPVAAARREAVRGTYDPTYGGYCLGRLAALKLRRDVERVRGAAFNLREFHAEVMTHGIAPWRIHRELMLPGDAGAVVE